MAPRRRNDAPSLPSTLQRSEVHAQRIFAETLAAAVERYGDGERARRTAFGALKHSYEKVGDHWEPKARRGPSDERSAARGVGDEPSHGGVDANASVAHLRELARRLGVRGRSKMTKADLVAALEHANQLATARARAQSPTS
jgi:cation transport regulator ChaB